MEDLGTETIVLIFKQVVTNVSNSGVLKMYANISDKRCAKFHGTFPQDVVWVSRRGRQGLPRVFHVFAVVTQRGMW